ncbi:GNAT family N-acetyltransferase [Pseudooctadecabacter jejudonensis]|uniref:L-ornithine N(alpha)-acyltransferase n=1 Tax=Pseudooctadecabacter jejudonensis TaxID=1391910 RepID=A0A1Y5RDV5_9RHOB|nr:GNAT family N-acyltransferase [Pseudooctadecabacter jejudonensis]SLN15117.1 hypothetical protein PSJ8397_00329 [Pseudooctadecabacter jejudonensis]
MMERRPRFSARLASCPDEVAAAQRLRYSVFVEEMGADGPMVDHPNRREIDAFDAHCEQLILVDQSRAADDQVVGVYRLMDNAAARAAGGFYSEEEFDLTRLHASGRAMLELGRTCLHPDYRGGTAMLVMWQALARQIDARGVEVLFGAASFHGTDLHSLAPALHRLWQDHMAPEALRVTARGGAVVPDVKDIDRIAAMKQVPALIKAYLRLGGVVGQGVFVDQPFNTTDVCLILDLAAMSARQKAIYGARA